MAQIKGSITVFPARAGVIPMLVSYIALACGLSRTSGGDPTMTVGMGVAVASFPHERG